MPRLKRSVPFKCKPQHDQSDQKKVNKKLADSIKRPTIYTDDKFIIITEFAYQKNYPEWIHRPTEKEEDSYDEAKDLCDEEEYDYIITLPCGKKEVLSFPPNPRNGQIYKDIWGNIYTFRHEKWQSGYWQEKIFYYYRISAMWQRSFLTKCGFPTCKQGNRRACGKITIELDEPGDFSVYKMIIKRLVNERIDIMTKKPDIISCVDGDDVWGAYTDWKFENNIVMGRKPQPYGSIY
jgi:hypothetical protein